VTRPESLSFANAGLQDQDSRLGLVSGDHENDDITTMTHDRITSEYAEYLFLKTGKLLRVSDRARVLDTRAVPY
jgi:hypothetical protein